MGDLGPVSSTDSRARVEDYLNDQFQNVADLENIDSLLAKIREQQDLLKQQLEVAKRDQEQTEHALRQASDQLKERATKHEAEQADLNRSIQVLTHSDISDNAVGKFEESMVKLRRIEIAEGYVKTIQEAEQLDDSARKNLQASPQDAVKAYQSLQTLLHNLEGSRPATEDAAPHLFDTLSTYTRDLYQHIKNNLEDKLRKSLDGMKWPKNELTLPERVLDDWTNYSRLLLQLQEPSLLKQSPDALSAPKHDPFILLPLAVMVNPLSLRFRYHFYGDKPTNRLDKPEYFFSHFLDLLEQHNAFMADHLQPLLDERVQQDDRLEYIYTDAISSFITAMLPMASAKCLSLLPQIKSQPQLMSHFIRELMSFDTSLQHSWAYSPFAGPLSEWKGLTWDMLTTHGYFDAWLKLEKDFALSRYEKIRDNPESNEIDYEGVEEGRTKPTKGAIRVNDLLETVTDAYRRLSSFSQKMKFLMDIQLSIFDDYHSYLLGAFQAYRTSSHTAGRMLSGQTAEDAMGQKGLGTLLKIFGSAEYLERKMADWSDDVFFLELWDELQDRASRKSGGTDATVGRNLSVDEVAAKTSSSIRKADEMLKSDAGGALFDETALSYRRLRELSEAEITRALEVNSRNAIRPFLDVPIWASISSAVTNISQMSPTSALDSFNQTTSTLLGLLAKSLAPGPLRRTTKRFCLSVQTEIYDRLLLKHSFSAAGANQLKRDLISICDTIDQSLRISGEAWRHFTRLNDALTLLCLPIKASRKNASVDDEDIGDEWGFGDDDEEGEGEKTAAVSENVNANGDEEAWGLWQAEKAIFADNASARDALDSMGITELSEGDARNVIRRRIEVNS